MALGGFRTSPLSNKERNRMSDLASSQEHRDIHNLLSVTQSVHALFCVCVCVQNLFARKAHNITQNYACITHKYVTELLSQRLTVFSNKGHETSASWNYTLLGHTPKLSWGIDFGQQ